jgi:hypothetical protein
MGKERQQPWNVLKYFLPELFVPLKKVENESNVENK